jgi:hypothetical protein
VQEAERIHKEQQEVAVAEMRIIIENEIKAKYEAARVAELQAAQDLREASEEVRISDLYWNKRFSFSPWHLRQLAKITSSGIFFLSSY